MITARAGAVDRRLWFDIGLACLVPAVQLVLLILTGALQPWTAADAVTISLVLVQGVPLAARRSRPWPVFLVILVANSAYYALGLPPTGYDLGLAVALYSVAEQREARSSLIAYAIVVVEMIVMKLAAVGPYWSRAPWYLVSYLCVYFGAAWLWGSYQRVRAQRLADLVANAERERAAAAEAAGREERTRIARELHDVIAHHLSLMVIQAGGARRLVENDPRRAREALTVIEEYGRRGLEAMPGLLKALRAEPEADSRTPAPRLDDVATLVDQLQRSGLPVQLNVRGGRPLPDSIELSAYRIVQESLTNAIRHARGAPVRVDLDYQPERLVIEVSDDGPGLASDRSEAGHGLTGMRERALLLGGDWQIGSSPSGGCLVRAWLPCLDGKSA